MLIELQQAALSYSSGVGEGPGKASLNHVKRLRPVYVSCQAVTCLLGAIAS